MTRDTVKCIFSDADASELTCYRKFAKIPDEMLDNTILDFLDGERANNIRINKANLRCFLDLPISEADKNKVMTVGMDWTVTMGHMFAVKPLEDISVATHIYIDELPSFLDTLGHL
ncbi:MAG: hypothetical protein EXX96DRAFT_542665 [Benjaminiella poitrasii]|nr:MAG: hypothetical protein EXX96DRAFT_542665 [Benjaminiella poitrasii]